MDRRKFVKTVPSLALIAASASGYAMQNAGTTALQAIVITSPEKDGGKSVLAAWLHNCDKESTVKEFNLKQTQRVLFAQTVGYPA